MTSLTSSTSSTSSSTGYVSFWVIRACPITGKLTYAHDGVFLTRELAQAHADSQASWGFGFGYEVYSGVELQALLDSGVRVYLW